MMDSDLLATLMRNSAQQTLKQRMIRLLLGSLGLQPTATELVIPLGAGSSRDNSTALSAWLDARSEAAEPADSRGARALLAELQQTLSNWEAEKWAD